MDPELQHQVAEFYRRAIAEGASDEQATRLARRFEEEQADPGRVTIERPGRLRSAIASAVQGATLGFGDEIGAAIMSAPRLMPGGRSFGDAYAENVEAAREGLAAGREDFPKQSFAADVAGAIVPAVATLGASTPASAAATGARVAPTIGRLAATGAAMGALEGAGRAEGNLLDRAPEAVTGGVIGGATGGLLPFLGKGLSKIGSSLGFRVRAPETRAADEILDALDAPPQAIRGRLTGAADETLMDVSPGARTVGETAALYPNARPTLENALESRAGQQFPRIQGALEGGTGINRQSAGHLADDILVAREQAARPLYQQAYAQGQVDMTPELVEVLQKPSIRAAFERAKRIAAEEGVELGEIGYAEGANSFVVPTVQALDYIKRGLDDVLYTGKMPESGLGPAALHAIRQTRRQFMDAVTDATGGPNAPYAQAREVFAGFTAMRDALDLGRSRFHLDPPAELARMLDDMTPGEVQMFRRGAVDNVLHRLGNVATRRDLMKTFVDDPNDVARMALLFDDPAEFQRFMGTMRAMEQQGVTRDVVLRGSPTARRLTGRESFEGTGVGSTFSPRTLLDEIATGRRQSVGEATAGEAANLLTRTDVPTLLDLLEGRAATREGIGRAARAGTNVGSIQSSRLLTPLLFPEEENERRR